MLDIVGEHPSVAISMTIYLYLLKFTKEIAENEEGLGK